MSFFNILYTVFIGPIQLIYEIFFNIANLFIGNPGLSIIVLSLMMNLLVLPLYRRADAMQEESRDIEAKLRKGVSHIKKTFSGDERMMVLQTYYRQNDYKPTNALNGSVSLLLEIPFFIAAYQFLSHLRILEGVSLGPIADLSSPDALIVLGGITINLLPILMTLINVISGALYAKGFPLKTKIQLYGMALIFLIFLYNSPAGLVFYWTLNNVFSLVKTLFYKLKHPAKVLRILCAVIGIILMGYAVTCIDFYIKFTLIGIVIGLGCEAPIVLHLLKKKQLLPKRTIAPQPNKKLFLIGSLFLTVLVGLLIPSAIIADSPAEFIDITQFYHPIWYVVHTLCLAMGSFLIWMRVFYWIAAPQGKTIFDKTVWILCGIALINYMFFGTDLGILTASLQYESGFEFVFQQEIINFAILAAAAMALFFLLKKWQRFMTFLLTVCVIAIAGMSVLNIATICTAVADTAYARDLSKQNPHFALSQTGKNVIVLMLDRAMGEYVPYIFNEKPELKEQFDGFTYYANTLSLGGYTNFATPSLFGGYEYTPVEMNKRDEESLTEKHNEALKVMPVLFDKNGYEVTVCDPPYANYQWIPDLSIYDDYPDINTYITEGMFGGITSKDQAIKDKGRNFFCFSIMKTMPLCAQEIIYNNGNYNNANIYGDDVEFFQQTMSGLSVADGITEAFMKSYNVLLNLNNMTKIQNEDTGTFLMMSNIVTHEPMLLREPEYEPAHHVDNTAYDAAHTDRFTVNGKTLKMETEMQVIHYQTNMAAMIRLGKWFDYMRENDVYDNTRIIIVSDHGCDLDQIEGMILDTGIYIERYYPLLLVKDFGSTGFTTSEEFMTNADVATLATEGTIAAPINPFTGKEINNSEKTAHPQYVTDSYVWSTNDNHGNTFLPSRWYAVEDDMRLITNWDLISPEASVLPPGVE